MVKNMAYPLFSEAVSFYITTFQHLSTFYYLVYFNTFFFYWLLYCTSLRFAAMIALHNSSIRWDSLRLYIREKHFKVITRLNNITRLILNKYPFRIFCFKEVLFKINFLVLWWLTIHTRIEASAWVVVRFKIKICRRAGQLFFSRCAITVHN